MRLSSKEVKTIKTNVENIFGDAIIYLFGSRLDDSKKGGDIDLYIITEDDNDLFRKKNKIKTILEDTLYKPIDIVIAKDKNRAIEKEALLGLILTNINSKEL